MSLLQIGVMKYCKYKSLNSLLLKILLISILVYIPLKKSYSLPEEISQNQNNKNDEEEKEDNTQEIIEKIEINYDNPPSTYFEMLKPLPKIKYEYETFIKIIDITIDLSFPFQYLLNKFHYKDEVINPQVGLGILWKKGIYTLIDGGYSIIECDTIPKDDSSYKYNINGAFLEIGLGYKFEYKKDNLIGFIFKYGGSYFSKKAKTKNINKEGVHAHWLKLILDAKSRIFRNVNLFFGAQLGLKYLFYEVKIEDKLKKFMIPNYGMNDNKFGITFGIYLQYSIPMYKDYLTVN
ncbi:MAG: hypothetical protein GY830_01960 [Bacteroidetes bacterium]|nr:hypothetical protein [Bacteroidota bacterium]